MSLAIDRKSSMQSDKHREMIDRVLSRASDSLTDDHLASDDYSQLDLLEREALRLVNGLSTEL